MAYALLFVTNPWVPVDHGVLNIIGDVLLITLLAYHAMQRIIELIRIIREEESA